MKRKSVLSCSYHGQSSLKYKERLCDFPNLNICSKHILIKGKFTQVFRSLYNIYITKKGKSDQFYIYHY